MTVFLKSTVLPCPSVIRPSSSTCRSKLNTPDAAFSISSKRMTEYGCAGPPRKVAAFLVTT